MAFCVSRDNVLFVRSDQPLVQELRMSYPANTRLVTRDTYELSSRMVFIICMVITLYHKKPHAFDFLPLLKYSNEINLTLPTLFWPRPQRVCLREVCKYSAFQKAMPKYDQLELNMDELARGVCG